MDKKTIGAFIAALRKANGLTQKQLADKLCVSDKAVSRWERDETLPDLTLIPVMAELFGVTSDELLRGQRANPDATPTPQAEEKSQKRLQYLLDKTRTNFQIRCIIAVMLALAGLIMAMILNLACLRAYAGFLCGSVFFLTAAVYLAISYIQAKTNLRAEDFDPQLLQSCTRSVCRMLEFTLSVVAVIFVFTFPLLVVGGAYVGLSFGSWLTPGILYAAIAAILCAVTCFILNGRLGIRAPLTAKGKLFLKFTGILAIVVAVTVLVHLFAANLLYSEPHLYSPGTKFDTFEDFKAYMETPLSPDGEPLTFVETVTSDDDITEYIYIDSGGTYYYAFYSELISGDPDTGFYNANHAVRLTSSSSSAFYTYDSSQYAQAKNCFILINLLIAIIYPAEVAIIFLTYRKKAQALPACA